MNKWLQQNPNFTLALIIFLAVAALFGTGAGGYYFGKSEASNAPTKQEKPTKRDGVDLVDLEIKADSIESKVGGIESKVDDMDEKIDELEKRLKDMQDNLESIKSKLRIIY